MKLSRKVGALFVSGLIVLSGALVSGGLYWVRFQQQEQCDSGNETRVVLLDVLDELRPASLIRRPGETDDQYAFRQRQNQDIYGLLHKRLAPKDC